MVVLIIANFCFAAQGAVAAPKESIHITTGWHKIGAQGTTGAKKAAIKNALDKAVQNAFSSVASQQQLGKNLTFLYNQILAQTMDFVSTYRVINGTANKGIYLVGVESKISLELLEKRMRDAGIFNQASDNPKVLLLIAEQGPEDTQPQYWWWQPQDQAQISVTEKSLNALFEQARIPLVVTSGNYPDPGDYNIIFSSPDDQTAAMTLGQALKADLVVLGQASAQMTLNRMGDDKTFEAGVSFKVLDMASQKEVIQTTSTATAKSTEIQAGAEQALGTAAENAGQALRDKIEAFWAQAIKDKRTFDLYVEGDNFLTRFIALKRQLKDIREIEDISPSELGSSHAIMEVTYKGTPEQFANAVMLRTFEQFGIDISMVSDDQVKIRFVATKNTNEASANTATSPDNTETTTNQQQGTSAQEPDNNNSTSQGIFQETLQD